MILLYTADIIDVRNNSKTLKTFRMLRATRRGSILDHMLVVEGMSC